MANYKKLLLPFLLPHIHFLCYVKLQNPLTLTLSHSVTSHVTYFYRWANSKLVVSRDLKRPQPFPILLLLSEIYTHTQRAHYQNERGWEKHVEEILHSIVSVSWLAQGSRDLFLKMLIILKSLSLGQNQGVGRFTDPPSAVKENLFQLLPASGGFQHSLVCGHITLISTIMVTFSSLYSLITLPYLSLIRTPVVSFRALPYNPRIIWI